jgi:flagellar basal body P-ring formation protein FlgA
MSPYIPFLVLCFISHSLCAGELERLAEQTAKTTVNNSKIIVKAEPTPVTAPPPCTEAIDRSIHARSPSQLTVQLQCHNPHWKRFIAVRLEQWQPILVSTRPIKKGQKLQEDDITHETINTLSLHHGVIPTLHSTEGMETTHAIPKGRILKPEYFTKSASVKKGQIVTLTVVDHRIQVQTKGVALQTGIQGDRIAVKNTHSGRILEGTVDSNGHILIH